MRNFLFALLIIISPLLALAQHTDQGADTHKLGVLQDSLANIGKKLVNDDNELERRNANIQFIKTLVAALKTPHSYNFPFDSVKSMSIVNAPDNRFRIFTWHIMFQDGSYRFYGAIQMNNENLQLYPLEDYSPFIKNAEDTVTNNQKWYGAQYYKIIHVTTAADPYYVLLGWKGNNVKSTKKVIDVLSFKDRKPIFGLPVFEGNGSVRKRIVFEYTRQASLLLRYVSSQHLIVFDELAPPNNKMKDKPDTYGPDMVYNGYYIRNGKLQFAQNLDMRNVPSEHDEELTTDPKKQAIIDRSQVRPRN